jgi:type IV secretory pathway TrbL component
VLIPFGLFGKTAFMAERVLGNVVSSGIKVLVLAVIVGIGSTMFSEFTSRVPGSRPSRTRWRSCSPRWRCWASASSAPASPTASSRAVRSLAQARLPERHCSPVVRDRQTIAHTATLAAHTLKSGDSHGGGASIDTSEKD